MDVIFLERVRPTVSHTDVVYFFLLKDGFPMILERFPPRRINQKNYLSNKYAQISYYFIVQTRINKTRVIVPNI